MGPLTNDTPKCPYCGRALQWAPSRLSSRGCFQCHHCGDFPDFRQGGVGGAPTDWSRPGTWQTPPVGGQLRVLLVDDSPEHLSLYALMLQDLAVVTTATRGEDALVLAGARRPDVVLLDVMMPGMDGWAVCECLKRNRVTAGIPIIMLTSLEAPDVPARAQAAGAAAVLMKPCPFERLVLTLNAATHHEAAPL